MPLISTDLWASTGSTVPVSLVPVALGVLSFLCVLALPETRDHDFSEVLGGGYRRWPPLTFGPTQPGENRPGALFPAFCAVRAAALDTLIWSSPVCDGTLPGALLPG
ncbi:hypothetical protein A4R44_02231 [Amycolatopsis sp. M39]|uniref:Uncharacterized protein n=1 Tax=Amycolatopsis rubida TaxID=112413 RepID=A0A1I5PN56_9PSEU|nr:hypothetical protein A4R44_02231 [Amycolatopsis sp. M39]SFP35509.1 hypothetical protein SAMN05421854_10525 [Amycolatopsis rubida]